MKKIALHLIVGLIFLASMVLAQTNLPPRWSPAAYHFSINDVSHSARIEQRAIDATAAWSPSQQLPLNFEEVETVARKELRKLVTDDGVWQVDQFSISRTKDSKWYYVVEFRTTVPRKKDSISAYFDSATVLVDFSGRPGYFDDN